MSPKAPLTSGVIRSESGMCRLLSIEMRVALDEAEPGVEPDGASAVPVVDPFVDPSGVYRDG
jgi:hypothetical protein